MHDCAGQLYVCFSFILQNQKILTLKTKIIKWNQY